MTRTERDTRSSLRRLNRPPGQTSNPTCRSLRPHHPPTTSNIPRQACTRNPGPTIHLQEHPSRSTRRLRRMTSCTTTAWIWIWTSRSSSRTPKTRIGWGLLLTGQCMLKRRCGTHARGCLDVDLGAAGWGRGGWGTGVHVDTENGGNHKEMMI